MSVQFPARSWSSSVRTFGNCRPPQTSGVWKSGRLGAIGIVQPEHSTFRGVSRFIAAIAFAFALAACAGAPTPVSDASRCYQDRETISDPAELRRSCLLAVEDESVSVANIITAHYNLARAEAALGDLDAAGEALDYLLLLDRTNEEARLLLARVRMQQGRFGAALAALDPLIGLGAQSPQALYLRAETYLARGADGDRLRALDDFEAVVRLGADTEPVDALVEPAREQIVSVGIALGRAALATEPITRQTTLRALEGFSAAAQVATPSAEIAMGCATAALRMATFFESERMSLRRTCVEGTHQGWFDLALAAFTRAAQLQPNDADAHAGRARALLGLGRSAAAIEAFETAASAAPGNAERLLALAEAEASWARELQARGELLRATRHWQRVAETLREASALQPAAGDTLLGLAGAYMALEDIALRRNETAAALSWREQAVDVLQRGRQAGMAEAELMLGRYRFEDGAGSYDAARAHFEAVLDGGPRLPSELRSEAHYYLSRIAVEDRRLGQDWQAARRHISEALALAPNTPAYQTQACLIRIGLGEIGETTRLECAADAPETARDLTLAGMYYLRRAHFARDDDKKRAWEAAYQAFTRGLDVLALTGEAQTREALRARLEVGRGIAHYCVGFARVGEETIDATGRLREQARAYFDTYRVAQCIDY